MQFWMAARLSADAGSAAPLVGVLSATAPQLVMEMEFAGWASGAGGFSASTTSMSYNAAELAESLRSAKVLPAAIGVPVTNVRTSSKKTRGLPSAGFWLLPL